MAPQSSALDLRHSVASYVDKILDGISGMKVVILDSETTGIISMVYSQSQILEKNVFLVEQIQSMHEEMRHLKGVVFIRPTRENMTLLRKELQTPKYGEYHIFFSNVVPQDILQQIANADEKEVVKQVHEFFADYYAINTDLFTLNLANSLLLSRPRPRWNQALHRVYQRCIEGMTCVLLSLKIRPTIRYLRSSELAGDFARKIKQQMDNENEMFSFREKRNCLLLILDRKDDPVTPLLTQWTYQAMVHELLGIHNNRVDLTNAPGVKRDMEQVVLAQSDPFFETNMYANFGDLGESIKNLLESYQKLQHNNTQIKTIEDMQNFVESYPEFKKFANNVSKHVAVMSELARLVDTHKLLDMSELEQELACASDHSVQLEEVKTKVRDPMVSAVDAVRLVLLYAIRYETYGGNQITALKRMLRDKNVSELDLQLVGGILAYAGASKRGGDLFGDSTLLSKSIKLATRHVKGVQNVYTQHKPLLSETIMAISKGRLKESLFPFVNNGGSRSKPQDVIIFMLGGVTYEEAAKVAEMNASNAGVNFILGGTCVHNSKSFLAELGRLGATGGDFS